MKLQPIANIPPKVKAIISPGIERRQKKNTVAFLEAFVLSGEKHSEVIFTDDDYKSARSCVKSLLNVIKTNGIEVTVAQRENRVFLTNPLIEK